MAWIQSYQDLGRHPKTGRRARTLGISRPAAIGHLHLLWWWALDYAKDGELAAYDAGEIADACMWDQDADAFVEALGARLQVTLGYTEHAGWFRPWVGETAWRAPLAGAIRIGMDPRTDMAPVVARPARALRGEVVGA